jgi:hypothetical protein
MLCNAVKYQDDGEEVQNIRKNIKMMQRKSRTSGADENIYIYKKLESECIESTT